MKDMTVDVIELQGGTYRGWHVDVGTVDRAARPLTVRPAQGAAVVFDASGDSNPDGLFYFGWNSYASYITFTGPFTVQNYHLGDTGVIWTGYVRNLTFNGFVLRNVTAPYSTNPSNAHSLYISSDGTHRGTNIVANDWNVDVSASGHRVTGLHMYHTPQAAGVTALRWTITGCYWGFVGRGDATSVAIDSWSISDCSISFDSSGPQGVVRNMRATNSGTPIIKSPMVDGGNNVWQ
jgi:hypothetical protein